MDKIILKLATLKSCTHLNMWGLEREHDEVLNVAKDNRTTETIEELDKFSQNLEVEIYFLQLFLLVILYLLNHIYQVLIVSELQLNNMLSLKKKKGEQHLNKLKPWKILLHQER